MAWNDTTGNLLLNKISDDELWSLFNRFMSSNSRKTSTYKYGFLKSIIDNLLSVEKTEKGFELTFEKLFSKFAENYWNLIVKYKIRQLRYNGKARQSKIEQICGEIVEKHCVTEALEFKSLVTDEQEKIIDNVKSGCKRNVIGAMYEDFDGKLYGFDLKEEKIWMSFDAYDFLLRYKPFIEKVNYYEWAKFLESINDSQYTISVLKKLEDATPKRNSLNIYRDILRYEFEEETCFY